MAEDVPAAEVGRRSHSDHVQSLERGLAVRRGADKINSDLRAVSIAAGRVRPH